MKAGPVSIRFSFASFLQKRKEDIKEEVLSSIIRFSFANFSFF